MGLQANELRISNWINTDFGYAQIDSICEVSVSTKNKLGSWLLKEIEPIELTPEILEACGFEKSDNKAWYASLDKEFDLYEVNGFEFINADDGKFYLWISTNDPYNNFFWTEIKYMHQLQNLYFDLIGKELPVKFV